MRALILNGAPEGDDSLEPVLQTLIEELAGRDYEVEAVELRQVSIDPCLGCFGCWDRTPGLCMNEDASRDISRQSARADLVVYLTPVTFGGYSWQLKKIVDRLLPNALPFFRSSSGLTMHLPRYAHYPDLVGIGLQPTPDGEAEDQFGVLVRKNARNLLAPRHNVCLLRGNERFEELRVLLTECLDRMVTTAE